MWIYYYNYYHYNDINIQKNINTNVVEIYFNKHTWQQLRNQDFIQYALFM